MENIKKYIKRIIEILSLKELRILPAYLAYSFVLASIPLFTIIVVISGRFNISIDTVINLVNEVLPGYVSSTITNVISGKDYDLSICFLIQAILCSKVLISIISLSAVGLGSPILPVAPPHNSIGLCPILANLLAVTNEL